MTDASAWGSVLVDDKTVDSQSKHWKLVVHVSHRQVDSGATLDLRGHVTSRGDVTRRDVIGHVTIPLRVVGTLVRPVRGVSAPLSVAITSNMILGSDSRSNPTFADIAPLLESISTRFLASAWDSADWRR